MLFRSVEHRLRIHQRHYATSLVTALVNRYPATEWLLGSDAVMEAARLFVATEPPHAPCIAEFGETFGAWLSRLPQQFDEHPQLPAAEVPDQVPMPVRKQRTHVLRALAEEKNRAFRQQFVGRAISVVSIEDGGVALSENYLKVKLARPRAANRIEDVMIGGLTADGLYEAGLLPVLPS